VWENIMARKKIALIAIAAVVLTSALLAVTTAGVLSSSQSLPSGGTVAAVQASVNIGVYGDVGCTQPASSVSWGTLNPGDVTTRTVWIKNTGTAAALLSMSTNGWSPANANQWLSITWNLNGRSIAPNEVVQATLTLSVSANVDSSITTFSVNILITGTG
jgi:hypothetical protein